MNAGRWRKTLYLKKNNSSQFWRARYLNTEESEQDLSDGELDKDPNYHPSTNESPSSSSDSESDYLQKTETTRQDIFSYQSNKNTYICDLCHKVMTSKHYLKFHIDSHKKVRILAVTCPICQKQFAHQSSLQVHLKIHSGQKSHSCSICRKKFTQKGDLSRHKMTHSGEKPFTCSKCKYKFTRRSDLNRHMRLHFGLKPFTCPHCKLKFFRKEHLQNHTERLHRGNPYFCSTCSKVFPTRQSIRRHAKTHAKRDQLTCSTCLKRFSNKNMLVKHVKTHSQFQLMENVPNVINRIKIDLTERFLIIVCRKLTQKEIHQQTSYVCPICQNLYPTKFLLAKHVKFHIYEEQFTCARCYKDFSSKNTLIQHLKIHSKKERIILSTSESKEDKQLNCENRSKIVFGAKIIKDEVNVSSHFDEVVKQEPQGDFCSLFESAGNNLHDDLFIKEEERLSCF